MHFKSVRTLVALMVGVCILLVVVALISYSLYADSRSQALVDVKTRALMTQSIDERLTAIASDRAQQIQALCRGGPRPQASIQLLR